MSKKNSTKQTQLKKMPEVIYLRAGVERILKDLSDPKAIESAFKKLDERERRRIRDVEDDAAEAEYRGELRRG